MKCHLLLITLLLCPSFLAAADAPPPPAAPRKPNIIFILSDDVGLGDIGCTGGSFATPHIDALAKSGLRFSQCYSTPLCGPSRCQLLTGRYPFRTGLISNQSAQAVSPKTETMLPIVMKAAGYVTASVGKWGQICLGPKEWGFDESLTFPGSGRYWEAQTTKYTVNGEPQTLSAGTYLPDVMHQFIVKFITTHQADPFFLYYPMSHIHGPIVRTPDSKPKAGKDQLYADNITYMDKLVGQLVEELERLKLRDDTLIIFSGDNGTAHFGVERAKVDGKAISGQKATMKEGGSRVPMIANWPGHTPAGKVLTDLVDFTDFFTTFSELVGATPPTQVKLDGHSFAPQLRGQTGTPRDWIYVELSGKSYAREARYKLTNEGQMFDLEHAPFEEIAVPAESTDLAVGAARSALQAVLQEHPAKAVGEGEAKPKAKAKAAKQAAKVKPLGP